MVRKWSTGPISLSYTTPPPHVTGTQVDPEKEKEEREKVEEQRIKDRTHLQTAQERTLEKGGFYSGGLDAQYLEEEDDDDEGEFQGGDNLRATLGAMRSKPPASKEENNEKKQKEAEEARERRILDAKRDVPTAAGSSRTS